MINIETMRFKCCFEVVSTCFIYAENWNGDVFPRVTASPVNFQFFFWVNWESKGFAFLSTCYSGSLCGNLDTVKVVYSFIQSTELILLLVALINCWSSRVPIKIAWSSCTSDFELINLSILYRWHSLTISLFMQSVHIIPTKCPINLQSIHTILLIFNLL